MVIEFLTAKLTGPIIAQLGKYIGGNMFEKFKLKRKLRKIKSFRREYDDTQVDTHAFQQFLNLDETQFLIFDYLFSSKFKSTSKQDMVQSLSLMAKEYINSIYYSQGRANLSDATILEDYFNFILDELIIFRDQELNGSQKSIVASIQNSIMESNSDLKYYIDNKYNDIKNYSLAKHLTDERIDELLERSIESLSGRYNPKANVETISKKIFKSLLFEDEIKMFLNEHKNLLAQNLNRFISALEKAENEEFVTFNKNHNFLKCINNNKEIIISFDCYDEGMYMKESFSLLVTAYKELRNSFEEFKYTFRKFENYKLNKDIQEYVEKLLDLIEDVESYLYELKPQLVNDPYLVIHGEGGIGKSHLLADVAEQKRRQGHIVFLFLGQHFTSQQQPFQQMFAFLEYKGDSDNFLSEINVRAKRNNKKALIFIDALNEGQGKYFWKNFIVDFIAKIKKYPHIVLVMSNRNNFMRSIFPDNFFKENKVTLYEHNGFLNLTLEQLNPFLNYYKVNPLIVPTLQSECRNPLFLKMYCEVASEKDFNPSLGWSITRVLSLYIKKVNTNLSNDQRFPFVGHINLVEEVLGNIAKRMLEINNNFLLINEAQDIISNVAQKYTEGYRIFINGLLEENLLSISKSYQGQENVYFNYERFGDIFISFELVNKMTQKESIGLNNIDVNYLPNIYEALSIVAPENTGKELFEILKQEKIEVNYLHFESFIRGLPWRKSNSISDKTISYIEFGMKQDLELIHLIYEQLILLSYSNNNLLNADYLHKYLDNMSLSERDSKWTIYVNDRPEIIERILELANFKHQVTNYSEKFTLLIATTVTWLLTSSNRLLRDRATHTLVNLLKENMEVVILLLEKFKNVNDPYVYERLYAAIYGACLRTEQTHLNSNICEYIINDIFRKDEVYPHALLRDYARGVLLYSHYRGFYKVENLDIINPPYNSEWFKQIPTLEEIDQLKLLYPEKKYGKKSYSISAIISSMTTEYGRGIGGYGDFGRYVFQSALSDWSNQFDVQDLSNIATMKVFELGYDIDTHGEYDLMNGRYFDRFSNTFERIGKKYQWIAFHELVARLSDNFPIYIEEKEYTNEYELQLEKYQERFMEALQDLGEETDKQEDKSNDDSFHLTYQGFNLVPEKHIQNIKRIAKPYHGSWNPFIRDIDTTILISKKPKQEGTLLNFELPVQSNKDWVHTKLNSSAEIFEIKYESRQYISLGSMYSNKREKSSEYENRDEIFIKTKALFVENDRLEKFKQTTLQEHGGNGVSWREPYQIYAFEHFWHPSYQDFVNEYDDDHYKQYYVQETVWSYLWENNYNYETDERNSISYLIPDASLVNYFNLTQKTEGVWVDEQGVKIALDASLFGYESCLLFDKYKLEEYLTFHNLALFWKVYIEKVSKGHYHEWWLLYELKEGTYFYDVLDEGSGKLRY